MARTASAAPINPRKLRALLEPMAGSNDQKKQLNDVTTKKGRPNGRPSVIQGRAILQAGE
ncbi:hypothetical protein GCM10007036_37710 [Alsobacter metallidurans]|uniref:Uncharacterized protein n=1 Tax=Alsobacter metallidurans TaxID=340221 RepID=A0A917MJC4_9HYPH|nr:hypothetical protein GCM10007036_37710 [Alsobacter metallidurans]